MNAGSPTRNRIVAALAAAAWLAIGIGAFQTFYLRIWTADRSALREQYGELPFRRIPGWRTLLEETATRTPPGARILIALPHRPWQSGYGYGFRRAQYVLAGREAVPLLDRESGRIDDAALARVDFVVCWRGCPQPPGFVEIWRGADGSLLRRVR